MNAADRAALRIGSTVIRKHSGAYERWRVTDISSSRTHFWLRNISDEKHEWVDLSKDTWHLPSIAVN